MESSQVDAIILTVLLTAIATAACSIPVTVWLVRRGELGRRIDELVQDIDAMEEAGIKFWELPANDERCRELKIKIRGLSRRIGSRVPRLNKEFFSFRLKDSAPLTIFRQSVTGHPFEESNRHADPARHQWIQDAATELQEAIAGARKLI